MSMSPCVGCRLPYAATLMLQFLHYAARARCLNVRRLLDKAATDLTDQHLRAFENRCDYKLGCKRIRRTNAGAARGPSVGGRLRRIAQRLASIDGRPWPHDGIDCRRQGIGYWPTQRRPRTAGYAFGEANCRTGCTGPAHAASLCRAPSISTESRLLPNIQPFAMSAPRYS